MCRLTLVLLLALPLVLLATTSPAPFNPASIHKSTPVLVTLKPPGKSKEQGKLSHRDHSGDAAANATNDSVLPTILEEINTPITLARNIRTTKVYGVGSVNSELKFSSTKSTSKPPSTDQPNIYSNVSWSAATNTSKSQVGYLFKGPRSVNMIMLQAGADGHVVEFQIMYMDANKKYVPLGSPIDISKTKEYESYSKQGGLYVHILKTPVNTTSIMLLINRFLQWPSCRFEVLYEPPTDVKEKVSLVQSETLASIQYVPFEFSTYQLIEAGLSKKPRFTYILYTDTDQWLKEVNTPEAKFAFVIEEGIKFSYLQSATFSNDFYGSKNTFNEEIEEGVNIWRASTKGTAESPEYFGVQTQSPVVFREIQLSAFDDMNYLKKIDVEVSKDGVTWTKVLQDQKCQGIHNETQSGALVGLKGANILSLELPPQSDTLQGPEGKFLRVIVKEFEGTQPACRYEIYTQYVPKDPATENTQDKANDGAKPGESPKQFLLQASKTGGQLIASSFAGSSYRKLGFQEGGLGWRQQQSSLYRGVQTPTQQWVGVSMKNLVNFSAIRIGVGSLGDYISTFYLEYMNKQQGWTRVTNGLTRQYFKSPPSMVVRFDPVETNSMRLVVNSSKTTAACRLEFYYFK